MADPPKEEDSQQHSPPGDRVRRYSATSGAEESTAQEGSKRRASLTHGLKESGHKVVEAVGALFKDRRGEEVDREDDPEYRYSQPTWEDDLKQYLPESDEYGAGPSTRPTPPGFSNVASTSSRPPMVPTEGTGNATVDLLLGIKKTPQSLAAYRWHKAYQFVKKQNACLPFSHNLHTPPSLLDNAMTMIVFLRDFIRPFYSNWSSLEAGCFLNVTQSDTIFCSWMQAMKKKAMSSPLGTGAKLHGRSLGIVPVSDETRQSIFNFWYQSYPPTKYQTFRFCFWITLWDLRVCQLLYKCGSPVVHCVQYSKAGTRLSGHSCALFKSVKRLERCQFLLIG